jgi:hypothetical protein
MDTKLTLNINKRVVKRAKEVAKLKGKSLSSLVENYLKILGNAQSNQDEVNISPRLKSLAGILKEKYSPDFDYKDVVAEHLIDKYLK